MGFKKGKSGNESGRPKLPADVRTIRELNKIELARRANQFYFMTREGLSKVVQDPNTEAIDLTICTLLIKGIEDRDEKILSLFLDRLIGKPHQTIKADVTTKQSLHTRIVDLISKIESENSDSEPSPLLGLDFIANSEVENVI